MLGESINNKANTKKLVTVRKIAGSSKKRGRKKEENSSFGLGFLWLVAFAFCLWLLFLLFNGSKSGSIGGSVASFFKNGIGFASYAFPFILLYCLATVLINVKKPRQGLLTMSLGLIVFISALCSLSARLEDIFAENVAWPWGGALGTFIDSYFTHLLGGFGSILITLLLLFAGIQLLFKIPWINLLISAANLIKEDYRIWSEGKKELNNKLGLVSEQEKSEKPYRDLKPIPEEKISKKTKTNDNEQPMLWPEPEIKKPEAVKIVRNNDKISIYTMPGTAEIKNAYGNSAISAAELKKQNINPNNIKITDPYYKDFKLPTLDLLDAPDYSNNQGPSDEETKEAKNTLENTFNNFGIEVHVTEIHPGPVVTRYEVSPGLGVKINSITALAQDVALAMRSGGAVRVTGQILGKAAIGFEIPNKTRAKVTFRELLESNVFNIAKTPLTVALGRHAEGAVAIADLEKMPHLLIAGATASGKSVFMQSLILSLIYRNKPDEVKFLFIDPKRMELTFYEDIPYLYDPKCGPDQVNVVTDPEEAAKSLQGMVRVMYERSKKFQQARVKNMSSYNKWALENNQPQEYRIIVVVDELADLMIQQRKIVEDAIQRLAQMARAVGIHLVLATQRPSTDVITGVIKANLPSRVALKVATAIDSRVIIDQPGANALIGYGDMLYLAPDKPKPERIQGAFVSEAEIKRVADFVKQQAKPNYEPLRVDEPSSTSTGKGSSSEEILNALRLIIARKRISQDLLKAHFGSSARATNILSILEMEGFIKKPEGSNRWAINFDKIEAHLKACENKSDNSEDIRNESGTEELIP